MGPMEKGPVFEAKARQNKTNALALMQQGAIAEAAEQERLACVWFSEGELL